MPNAMLSKTVITLELLLTYTCAIIDGPLRNTHTPQISPCAPRVLGRARSVPAGRIAQNDDHRVQSLLPQVIDLHGLQRELEARRVAQAFLSGGDCAVGYRDAIRSDEKQVFVPVHGTPRHRRAREQAHDPSPALHEGHHPQGNARSHFHLGHKRVPLRSLEGFGLQYGIPISHLQLPVATMRGTVVTQARLTRTHKDS
eukprot:scaffold4879_cov354-Prasinococcus_capsulatus_cf.AAC.6